MFECSSPAFPKFEGCTDESVLKGDFAADTGGIISDANG